MNRTLSLPFPQGAELMPKPYVVWRNPNIMLATRLLEAKCMVATPQASVWRVHYADHSLATVTELVVIPGGHPRRMLRETPAA